ncbi:MAG: phage baseplate protein [Spirochaetota bacterium]
MSIAILFGRTGQGAEIAGFELDATLREDHERSSRVTESAIEDGSIVQDHVVREPERVTVEGYVTDTPIVPLGIDTRTPQTLEAPENFRGRFAGTDNAFDVLDELHQRGELISINTRWRPYEDMVIERLQLPRRQDSDALRFTLTAVKVRRVKVRFTDVDFGDLDTEDEHLAGESDQGSQPTEEASVGEIESPLKLGLDALGKLF